MKYLIMDNLGFGGWYYTYTSLFFEGGGGGHENGEGQLQIISNFKVKIHDIHLHVKRYTVKAPVFGTLNSAISNFQT